MTLLVLFAALTVAAVVVDGTRPAADPGALATAFRGAGYACVLAAAVLLVREPSPGRRLGGVLVAAVALLVGIEVTGPTSDPAGADIGLGLVRLLALGAVVVSACVLASRAGRSS
ncbi:hypothetical protein [Blastococcus sp. TF02A-35]|uniref:hypothetical protein n=1 Tax=Blastococcus sp. TF02A-35 TaxID=2559612 RepID=UPI0014305CB3|nr:hypothetical protein [Blastococcus sp. TF02A_35]